jgi:hypothetical protein
VAIAVTARQIGTNGATAAASLTTDSQTPTANSLFIVLFGSTQDDAGAGTNPVISTPTGGSLSYTLVVKDGEGDNWGYFAGGFEEGIAAFRAPIGGAPSAFAVTVDASSANAFHDASCFDVTAGGGKTFTTIQSYPALLSSYRVADGAESTTVTCADVGNQVYAWSMLAFEIRAGRAPALSPRRIPPILRRR